MPLIHDLDTTLWALPLPFPSSQLLPSVLPHSFKNRYKVFASDVCNSWNLLNLWFMLLFQSWMAFTELARQISWCQATRQGHKSLLLSSTLEVSTKYKFLSSHSLKCLIALCVYPTLVIVKLLDYSGFRLNDKLLSTYNCYWTIL